MENKNGQGIFYGVIGVATLIVAIIGATFAFFAASANNNETIVGTTGSAGLILTITEESDGNGALVPQLSDPIAALGRAVTGTEDSEHPGTYKSCVDGNGNTVCHVYNIHIANTGASSVALNGTFALDQGGATNLKWGIMEDAATLGTGFTVTAASTTAAPLHSGNLTLGPADNADGGDDEEDFYVIVWLNETGTNQAEAAVHDNGKSFRGTVEFNTPAGTNGVTSTFTA